MAKLEQCINVSPPSELKFEGPFTDVVTATLALQNPTEKRVCFKVKTTAPKRYCVRPNSGFIQAGDTVNVNVMLQPFVYDPSERNKHKFMVQTVYVPDDYADTHEQLWKEVAADTIMDSKLKCVFENPESKVESEKATLQNNLNAVDEKTDIASHAVKASTEKTSPAKASAAPKPSSTDSSATEREKAAMAEEMKKMQEQLTNAKKANAQLKEESLRLRKLAMSDTTSSTPVPVQQVVQPAAAMPPLIYMIVALIVGLILGKMVF